MGRRGNTSSIIAAAVLLMAVGAVACSGSGDDEGGGEGEGGGERASAASADPAPELPRLHAVRGERPGIFDEDGRQVVLRGVNLNFLAEYARNNPDHDPTLPLSGHTWNQIANEGMNVVRLLVSWSRLQPDDAGSIDGGYVDQIEQAVADAAHHGVYVVIDMHQDAWGPAVATPEGVTCPPGQEPSNGWDGAPAWATPEAGVNSCRAAEGEAKPGSDLVVDAWDRFYRDVDDVQSSLVGVWRFLAEHLGDAPNIAGYDLLNEPGHGVGETAPPALLADFPALGDYYDRAIAAIRFGEAKADVDPRPIFFEQSIAGSPPPADFSDDPGLVFAPHIYGGSIIEFLSVDQSWDLALTQAAAFETSLWIGEYGWFDDPATRPEYVERATRFGQREDGAPSTGAGPGPGPGAEPPPFVPAGSAWWQWTTGCGDPHRIVDPGLEPEGPSWQYRLSHCPDGEDQGVVPEWRTLVTRPAVRFAPGWLTSVTSDGAARTLELEATGAEPGQELVLWFPGDPAGDDPRGDDRGDPPTVGGEGIGEGVVESSARGWLVRTTVEAADYRVEVAPAPSGAG